jgi:hypothetical protein
MTETIVGGSDAGTGGPNAELFREMAAPMTGTTVEFVERLGTSTVMAYSSLHNALRPVEMHQAAVDESGRHGVRTSGDSAGEALTVNCEPVRGTGRAGVDRPCPHTSSYSMGGSSFMGV